MTSRVSIVAAAALLALLVGLFFVDAATGQGAFFYFDVSEINYPFRHWVGQELHQGRLPLWTPHILAGFPLLAEGQAGPLYPPNWLLFAALPSWLAMNAVTLGHFWLAGLFMFAYMRLWTRRFSSALLSSVTFAFAGFLVTRAIHTNLLNAGACLPLIMLLVELSLRRGTRRHAAAAGAVYGVQILAGHVQFALFTGLAVLAYVALRCTLAGRGGSWARTAAVPALVAAVGVGLAAGQLLPTAELTGASRRAQAGSGTFVTQVSFPPENAATLLFPRFFGHLANDTDWSALPFHEASAYLGVAGLLLIAVACARRSDGPVAVHLGLALVAFLLMLGGYCVLWRLAAAAPMLNRMRGLARMVGVFTFAGAALVGLGHDYLLSNREPGARGADLRVLRWTVGLLAFAGLCMCLHTYLGFGWKLAEARMLDANPDHMRYAVAKLLRLRKTVAGDVALRLALLAAAWWLIATGVSRRRAGGRAALTIALPVLAVADLFSFGARCNPVAPPSLWAEPPAVAFLRKQPGIFRTYSEETHHVWKYPGWQIDRRPYRTLTHVLGENLSLLFGVDALNGEVPLSYARLWKLTRNRPDVALDLLNVRYVLTRIAREGENASFEQGAAKVYARPTALPRARVLRGLRPTGEHGLRNPRQSILVEDRGRETVFACGQASEVPTSRIRYDPHRVSIRVADRGAQPGDLAALADACYPGWRAYVDGRRVPVLLANTFTRAVRLPAGADTLNFVFAPRSFKLGLALSLPVAAGVVVVLCLSRKGAPPAKQGWQGRRCGRHIAVLLAAAAGVVALSVWTERGKWRQSFRRLDACDRIREYVDTGQLTSDR